MKYFPLAVVAFVGILVAIGASMAGSRTVTVCTPNGCYPVRDAVTMLPGQSSEPCKCGLSCPCADQEYISMPARVLTEAAAPAQTGACASCASGGVASGDGGRFEGKPVRRILTAPFRLVKRLRNR